MAEELSSGTQVADAKLVQVNFTPIDRQGLLHSFVTLFGASDVHYVTYVSSDASWVLAHGLGKSNAYTIPVHQIASHSPQVILSLPKVFTNKFTYIRSDSGDFMLLRNDDGLYSLFVRATTGRMFRIEQSIAFLYQLPHTVFNGIGIPSAYIEVVAESSERIENSKLDNLYDIRDRLPRKINVKDTVPEIYRYDAHALDFAIHHYN